MSDPRNADDAINAVLVPELGKLLKTGGRLRDPFARMGTLLMENVAGLPYRPPHVRQRSARHVSIR